MSDQMKPEPNPSAASKPSANPFRNLNDPAVRAIKDLYDRLEQQPSFKKTSIRHFRLDENHNVEPCSMFEAMVYAADDDARRIAYDDLGDNIRVSTVFLGGLMVAMPHSGNPPRLFETMIMGGPRCGYQIKALTWEEAERNHKAAVIMARG